MLLSNCLPGKTGLIALRVAGCDRAARPGKDREDRIPKKRNTTDCRHRPQERGGVKERRKHETTLRRRGSSPEVRGERRTGLQETNRGPGRRRPAAIRHPHPLSGDHPVERGAASQQEPQETTNERSRRTEAAQQRTGSFEPDGLQPAHHPISEAGPSEV